MERETELSGSKGGIDGYAGGVGLVFDVDPSTMEPLQRSRANTWHGRARVDDDDRRSTPSSGVDSPAERTDSPSLSSDLCSARTSSRRPASRKNAWGNLSYADLITQAIDSSPDKRLTLAQIYDWMVTNVPFFKDKGDSNSSAGWKNSIRHNLSLHSRFMRIQNEGAGKSSWWVINPDALARTTKTHRRPRAFTLDTKAYERQRRSRVQRQSRDQAPVMAQRSPASARVIDSTDEPRDPFGLEYRARASSFGGRLSPIDARPEPDTVDSMDCLPLARCHYDTPKDHFPYVRDGQETLSETLADILAGDLKMTDITSTSSISNAVPQSAYVEGGYNQTMPYIQPVDFYQEPLSTIRGCDTGNSSYGSNSSVSSPAQNGRLNVVGASGSGNLLLRGSSGIGSRSLNVDHVATGSMPNLSQLLAAPLYRSPYMSRGGDVKPKSCMFEGCHPHVRDIAVTSSNSIMVKASSCGMVPDHGVGQSETVGQYSGLLVRPGEERPAASQKLDRATVARILAERPHLMGKMQKLIELKRQQLAAELHHHQYQQQQQQQPVVNHPADVDTCHLQASCGTVPQLTIMPTDPSPITSDPFFDSSTNSFFPSDLDLNGVDFAGATMDCDIDQVIRHELALDGKLDFMFDSLPTPTK